MNEISPTACDNKHSCLMQTQTFTGWAVVVIMTYWAIMKATLDRFLVPRSCSHSLLMVSHPPFSSLHSGQVHLPGSPASSDCVRSSEPALPLALGQFRSCWVSVKAWQGGLGISRCTNRSAWLRTKPTGSYYYCCSSAIWIGSYALGLGITRSD